MDRANETHPNIRNCALAAGPSLPVHDYGDPGTPGGSGLPTQHRQPTQHQRTEESSIIANFYAYGFHYGIPSNHNYLSFNSGRETAQNARDYTKQQQQQVIDKYRKWVPVSVATTAPGLYFTVLNYNVLAQDLVQENAYLYRNHSARACLWETRWNNLYREIAAYNADIVCLQEVQESHLRNYYKQFEAIGYAGIYKKRTGMRPDGCAIYYKRAAFKLMENTTIEFNQGTNALDRENVAIIVRLAPKQNPTAEFVVATTHLLYNPRRMDVRLAQTQVLLAEIERMAYTARGQYVPIVLTGDFNSQPDSAVYRLIVGGRLKYDHLANRTLVPIGDNATGAVPVNGKVLLTPLLKITDNCQHYELVKSRDREVKLTRSQELSLINLRHSKRNPQIDENFKGDSRFFSTGTLSHNLNLLSAFKHVADDDFEATTHQNAWITVDYIFYSGKFDNRTGQIAENKLKLIENYRLPTATELQEVKYIPNFVIGSDHLPLLSKFKLIY